MKTAEKYKEMGFIELSDTKVQDRHGKVFYPRKVKKPLKAIREFCAECMGMDRRDKDSPFPYNEIRDCSNPMCPLFDFRLGKNPFIGKPLSEEQKIEAVKRLSFVKKTSRML